MAEHVPQTFGSYQTMRHLGRGTFAEVYLARDKDTGKDVAIKAIDPNRVTEQAFEDEVAIVRELRHPHIVQMIDSGMEQDVPYIVMEYAANGSLRDRHPLGVRVLLATVVSYVYQIADALQYAHNKGVIHRDIKPENILVGRQGGIQLSDFNLALNNIPEGGSELLSTQKVAGTSFYIAPEQIEGKPHRASDQYALGVMVYEWLSGRRLFESGMSSTDDSHDVMTKILNQHLHETPRPLREEFPDIPLAVEQVIIRALEKEYKRRFPGVDEFAMAFGIASLAQVGIHEHLIKEKLHRKVVYYGIAGSGKDDNLRYIHQAALPLGVSDIITIDTTEPTLYFDLDPTVLGIAYSFLLRVRLFTIPGQSFYREMRTEILSGVSCIIFVADSRASKFEENVKCFAELIIFLQKQGKDIATFPLIMQWNKRDAEDALPTVVLERYLNSYHVPSFEAIAETGAGVIECLRAGVNALLQQLGEELKELYDVRKLPDAGNDQELD